MKTLTVLQGIVDTAVRKVEAQGHSIEAVLVYDHVLAAKREAVAFREGVDVWWQDVVPKQPTHCPVEWMGAEEPLFKVSPAGVHARSMTAWGQCMACWGVAQPSTTVVPRTMLRRSVLLAHGSMAKPG